VNHIPWTKSVLKGGVREGYLRPGSQNKDILFGKMQEKQLTCYRFSHELGVDV